MILPALTIIIIITISIALIVFFIIIKQKILAALFIAAIIFYSLYLYIDIWIMPISQYVRESRYSTITDIVYISDDGQTLFYLDQPTARTGSEALPTLHMTSADNKVKKQFTFENIVEDMVFTDDTFAYTTGKKIYSYNYKNDTLSQLYEVEAHTTWHIFSLDITDNGEYLVFAAVAGFEKKRESYPCPTRLMIDTDAHHIRAGYISVSPVKGKIYLHNTKQKVTKEILFDESSDVRYPQYPLISNNNDVIFTAYDNLYLYDITKDKSKLLFKGRTPEISKNDNTIVFRDVNRAVKKSGEFLLNTYDIYTYDLKDKTKKLLSESRDAVDIKNWVDCGDALASHATHATRFIDISADGSVVAYFEKWYSYENDYLEINGKEIVVKDIKNNTSEKILAEKDTKMFDAQNSLKLSKNGKYLAFSGYGFKENNKNIPEIYILKIDDNTLKTIKTPYQRERYKDPSVAVIKLK